MPRSMTRQLITGLRITAVLTVLLGLLYPLAVTAVSQVAFKSQAEGSLVERDGKPVGSSLLGQSFAEPTYFHPRPSAAGDGYDPLASSGSNLGPSNQKLLDAVAERVAAVREENGLADDAKVPVDAVTASASGLDPQISVAYARLQAPRVADARGVTVDTVLRLVDEHTQARQWGFLGENGVNVLNLNLALDEMS
jgi:potassium-transporting ATPase KdpC subunit